jgi:osmotically-inducible protein OsmY
MATTKNSYNPLKLYIGVLAIQTCLTAAFIGLLMCATSLYAQDQPRSTTAFNSTHSDEEQVHTSTLHNYQSEADRANDALVITEVKKALIDDGIAAYRAVVVDCDHGTVYLNGVVGSAADAQHAAEVARSVDGVVAIKNGLRWQ